MKQVVEAAIWQRGHFVLLSTVGVNTISYLLYSYGIFGLLFLAAVSWIYDEHRLKLRFICLLPLLLTYSYFTYFIFPFLSLFCTTATYPETSQVTTQRLVKLGKRAKLENENASQDIIRNGEDWAFISHRFGLAKHAISLG